MMVTVFVGAVSSSSSTSDGSLAGLALAAMSACAAAAHRVDLTPFGVCVRWPRTVAVAFAGQYLATFSTLRPGKDLKFPALTAVRKVLFVGEPTQQ